jgi:hypothetical protein
LSLLLTESANARYIAVASAIAKSIREKHILFTFPNKEVQSVFALNGFSSTLVDNREKHDGQFNDFLGVNEANLGANKVNYYIDRAINHKVVLNVNGVATETVTIQYQNKSTTSNAFGGDYKTYVRFILPIEADLDSISIDSVNQQIDPALTDPSLFPPASTTIRELEVETAQQEGKRLYGFYTIIPMSSRRTIAVTYKVASTIAAGQASNTYSLRLFKQPGTDADPYALSLIAPQTYQITSDNPRIKVNGVTLSYIADLSEDREVTATITKR